MEPGTTYQCYVGSVGWEARGWDTAFYPEGLPTEWRLGYYNQFYSCVYLSYAGWSNAGDETLGGWENMLGGFIEHVRGIDENVSANTTPTVAETV
jgi:hypothetical protein